MSFTLNSVITKEIESLLNLREHITESSYNRAVDLISNCIGKVIVTGVGKSGHIASKIAATMASTGTPAFFVHPGEACHGDLGMIEQDDLVIAISHSGESSEIMTILPICKKKGNVIISITSNPNSSIAKISDVHLNTYVKDEAGALNLAPTCSTTVTLVLGDAIAMALAERKNFTQYDFAVSHPGGALGKRLFVLNSSIMHTGDELPLVNSSCTISNVILEITRKKLGFAIIVNSGTKELLGIFTDGDLRRILSSNVDVNHDSIGVVTHNNCITVKPDQRAYESLKLMQLHSINALIVVDNSNKVVGALNMHDLVNAGFK